MQITKINGLCSIPEMIQVIIYLKSKFRSSLGLEIAEKGRQKQSISKHVFRLKFRPKTKLKQPKQSLNHPQNVNEVCMRFPVLIRKESRHLEK